MDLTVQTREKLGKAGALRKQGLIPAELYGHGLENMHLTVDAKEFKKLFKEAGENTVVTLIITGNSSAKPGTSGEKRPALIHDIQRDFIHDTVSHIDFYQVRMDEKITAHIPIEFVGEAPAVKEHGGLLNKSMTEIEVEALPADLPHRLTVDLSGLTALNQSAYVKDIVVPKGVRILIDLETAVATVTEKMKEEEIAPAAPVDVSTVKVESEEKKVERDKEKAEKEEK